MHDFRFGFSLATHSTYMELTNTCRTAEAYGYDVAVAVDHLGTGRTSPFLALLAAARATETMRVGTFVLDIGFWNPSLLARDVASMMRLTESRLELGLGAGIVKAQFKAANIPFLPFDARMDRLAATIDEVSELLAKEEGISRPPILVGGTGDRALRLAAQKADIVSFGGLLQVPGHSLGTFRIPTGSEADERVAFFAAAAGARDAEMERNCFVQEVVVTDDRKAAAAEVSAEWRAAEDAPHLSAEEALETPFVLLGTEDEITRQIIASRERYGFTSVYIQRHQMTTLGPIIKLVRALA